MINQLVCWAPIFFDQQKLKCSRSFRPDWLTWPQRPFTALMPSPVNGRHGRLMIWLWISLWYLGGIILVPLAAKSSCLILDSKWSKPHHFTKREFAMNIQVTDRSPRMKKALKKRSDLSVAKKRTCNLLTVWCPPEPLSQDYWKTSSWLCPD